MQINETPFYDRSDCPTGCCPRFNPEGWDGVELHFIDKPFLRAKTISLAHIPLNMGRVFGRVQAVLDANHAEAEQRIVLSRDPSAFRGEHLVAVKAPVPGEDMVTLSGRFLTKTFEGPFSKVAGWMAQMEAAAKGKGSAAGRVWMFYTTCPKCAKTYGKNPVVGVVELL